MLSGIAKRLLAGEAPGELREALNDLGAGSAELDEEGRAQITIGGILDNTAGYLFVPDGKAVPAMTPDNFILVEPVGQGWFLFKTT